MTSIRPQHLPVFGCFGALGAAAFAYGLSHIVLSHYLPSAATITLSSSLACSITMALGRIARIGDGRSSGTSS